LIDRQEMSQLLVLLSAKQELLSRLQVIERQLDPFRGQPPEQRQWSSPAGRSRCGQLLDRCEALLAEIVGQEKQSEQQLRTYRDEIGAQLAGANSAGRARHAYVAEQAVHVSQLDLTSEN
jgi:ADP-ribose pyrophosphatase YjhB (NUDIX family)